MRITGGKLRGRRVRVVGSGVRPTQEMVREALFSMIAQQVVGCRFLDLFAGSGAVGLGAWSRGAALVQWVESGRRALPVLKQNVRELCEENGRVWGGDVAGFLRKAAGDTEFDVIFADPPYATQGRGDRRSAGKRREWSRLLLTTLGKGGVLAPGGLFVMEQRADEALCEHVGWELVKDRRYGEARLRFFRQS